MINEKHHRSDEMTGAVTNPDPDVIELSMLFDPARILSVARQVAQSTGLPVTVLRLGEGAPVPVVSDVPMLFLSNESDQSESTVLEDHWSAATAVAAGNCQYLSADAPRVFVFSVSFESRIYPRFALVISKPWIGMPPKVYDLAVGMLREVSACISTEISNAYSAIVADRKACDLKYELDHRTHMDEVQKRKDCESAREKNQFFADLSHDLRAPLTSVIGFTEMLLEDEDDPVTVGQRHKLKRVKENAERLITLLNNIMDITKLDANRMQVHISPVNLPKLISQVLDTMVPLTREKDLVISADVDENIPSLWTDEQKLSRILVNLVSNAIQYTSKGSVKIRAARNNGRVKIAVTDTGAGIRQADLNRIFDEFTQAGRRPGRTGGTGLGLAITKRLVDLLDGEVSVSSQLGIGSEFAVDLPITPSGKS